MELTACLRLTFARPNAFGTSQKTQDIRKIILLGGRMANADILWERVNAEWPAGTTWLTIRQVMALAPQRTTGLTSIVSDINIYSH